MQQGRTDAGKVLQSARDLSRKDFLRLGGAGLAGAALLGVAGCGGGGEGGSGGSNTITFSWIPEQTGTLQKMIERFNKENEDGITVKFREMPTDATKHFDQIRTEFQASSDNIDVIGGDVTWPAQFAANGYYLDLSDRFDKNTREEFLEAPIQANTWNDKPYGVPWYTDSGMLYFRKDLLEKSGFSGPPKTWEELKQMSMKVTQDQDVKNGFVFQGANYEGGVCNGLEYIWTHGGNVLDPQNVSKVVIDSPESVRGLQMQQSLVKDGVSPKAVGSYKEQEAQAVFLGGDAVFMRNWPYIYGLAADESESSVRQEQIGVAPLPAGSGGGQSYSCLGGWNFAINANSKNPDAAWSFIQYMVDAEQEKSFCTETARIPVLKSLLDDEEVLSAVPVIKLGKEAISRTRPRPISPYYSDISLEMAEGFNTTITGDASPEETLSELQTEMTQMIEKGQSS